jgi:glycosyltransferase involved in cell wall biosynthesis
LVVSRRFIQCRTAPVHWWDNVNLRYNRRVLLQFKDAVGSMSHDSLRVLLVAPLWYPVVADKGGIEQVVFLLAQELVAQGHDLTLICTGDSAPLGRLITVCPESLVAAMMRGTSGEYCYYESVAVSEALRLSASVDIVHSHLNAAMIPFAPLMSTPVLHTHHIEVTNDLCWQLQRYPDTHLTTVSQSQRTALGWAGDVTLIPNGVDMTEFSFCAQPEDYLLFLGRLHPKKGVEIAINIAETLQQRLVIAGPIVDRNFFNERIEPRIDGDRIRYLGTVGGAAKVQLLQRAKTLLFPVLWDEAFGLVMAEAMACGTPVVALARGAVSEVVIPGVNGYHCTHPNELFPLIDRAAALDRAVVRQSAVGRYSHLQMVEQYVAAYRRLLG